MSEKTFLGLLVTFVVIAVAAGLAQGYVVGRGSVYVPDTVTVDCAFRSGTTNSFHNVYQMMHEGTTTVLFMKGGDQIQFADKDETTCTSRPLDAKSLG